MKRNVLTLAAFGAAILLAGACSSEDETATAPAEPAPVALEAPSPGAGTTADSFQLSAEDKALLEALSPDALGMARLSCINPLDSAKANKRLFDANLAAQLDATPAISQTKLLSRPPLNALSLQQARDIRDKGPTFAPNSPPPSASDITGLKQCIILAHHFAAELAAEG